MMQLASQAVGLHMGHSPKKLAKTVTERVTIQSVNFLMLLFGNESLTALVYINIRHKLTG